MTPDVVVDIGNTAMKWGLCDSRGVVKTCSLPHNDTMAWAIYRVGWQRSSPDKWVVAGVNPEQVASFREFLLSRKDEVRVLSSASELPLRVALDVPDKVGIDRLLDAVAANSRRPPGRPAVVIDAGSAVTVDWIDADGAFAGGAILPGFRLMARSLHEHTALLPLIDPPTGIPPTPGKATVPAMELGIYWAIAGGIRALIGTYARQADAEPVLYLTGGDAPALLGALSSTVEHWPTMTLEGIRLAAEALP